LTNKINNLDTLFTKIGDLSSYNAVHSLVEQITQLDTDISTLATATGIDLTATNPTTPLGNAIGDLIQEVEELSEKIGTGINNSDLTAAIMQLQQLLGSWLDTAE